jgi:hypothetical protein
MNLGSTKQEEQVSSPSQEFIEAKTSRNSRRTCGQVLITGLKTTLLKFTKTKGALKLAKVSQYSKKKMTTTNLSSLHLPLRITLQRRI